MLALRAWFGRTRGVFLLMCCFSAMGMLLVTVVAGPPERGYSGFTRDMAILCCVIVPCLAGCVWGAFRLQHRPPDAVAVKALWQGVRLIAGPDVIDATGVPRSHDITVILFRATDDFEFTVPCECRGSLCHAVFRVRDGRIRLAGFLQLTARQRDAVARYSWYERNGLDLMDPRTVYDRRTRMLVVQDL
ncbi:hypothetical protein [Bifidobacterium aerophilum]|uniref:Uncharacterized protein n=1 Tax=Bifidobacterium aerophilum TaxID=1798155 RepID=A0A6N9Z3U5_9BIFI|nr:hypothetical protein [Bifidobacterium aerophilum]NEG89258.1 hypothetical protein [Bifidobacterium aerophilum]